MKTMIYRDGTGTLCTTPEENFNARIQNARRIHRMPEFNSPAEIVEYYCRNFGSDPGDFIIMPETARFF